MSKGVQPPSEGDLRVWHIPQVPGKPFYVEVTSVAEGVKLCDILGDYDAFQLAENIKPDYCNVNGIQRYERDSIGPGWFEVYPEDEEE